MCLLDALFPSHVLCLIRMGDVRFRFSSTFSKGYVCGQKLAIMLLQTSSVLI